MKLSITIAHWHSVLRSIRTFSITTFSITINITCWDIQHNDTQHVTVIMLSVANKSLCWASSCWIRVSSWRVSRRLQNFACWMLWYESSEKFQSLEENEVAQVQYQYQYQISISITISINNINNNIKHCHRDLWLRIFYIILNFPLDSSQHSTKENSAGTATL